MNHETQIHVIGAGLAGLASAAFVAKAGHPVVVHDVRNRLGGRAVTEQRNGFRFNQGAHALYLGGHGERVLHALGVTPRGTAPSTKGAKGMRGRSIELLPGGPVSLLRSGLLDWRDRLEVARALTRLPRIDPSEHASTTVEEFIDDLVRRPRVRELLHALTRLATYVHAPGLLSAEVAVMQISAALGPGVIYLDHGWQQLVDALATTPGVRIEAGERATELPDAAAVIVATGGPEAAAALTGSPYASGVEAAAACLDLGLDRAPQHSFVIGVDEPRYLSDHSVAAGLAPDDSHAVSIIGYVDPGATPPTKDDLRSFAAAAGVDDRSIIEERYLHRMPVVTSIATAADGGLHGRPGVAVPDRPGVFVAGDWVGNRGHMADAVLASAEEASLAAVAHLERRPVTG